MLGKIITYIFFSLLFLFVFATAVLAECTNCDEYGNCDCPRRYMMVYTVDQNGNRWVERNTASGTSDNSPCTGGVTVLNPADGNADVYTMFGGRLDAPVHGYNNVLGDAALVVECSTDSTDRDYRGGHVIRTYREDDLPPEPRAAMFRIHPPAGYACENITWEKREGGSYNPSAPLVASGLATDCVMKIEMDYSDDWLEHVIVRISNVLPSPTPTPRLSCPASMSVSCNATGTLATYSWSVVPGAGWYGLRADANPLSWTGNTGGDGYNNINSGATTTGVIAIQPNTPYEWSIEVKQDPTHPNSYDDRCVIPGPISCNTSRIGLNLTAGPGATANSIKGSGLISSDATSPQIGQAWNNPLRATAYISTSGISNMGLIGIAFTPSQNGCTQMAVPPAATSPTPPGIMNTLLNDDGLTSGTNRGAFVFLPMNNVTFNGRSYQFGRFYVYYNGVWYNTTGGNASMPAVGTSLSIPNSITPHFVVRLAGYDSSNPSPFSASFDITFREQFSSKLWYTRAYAVDTGGVGGFHETVGTCIPPGDLREGSGSAADALILP